MTDVKEVTPIIQKLREFVKDGKEGTFGTVLLAEIDTLTRERDAERAVIEAAKVAEMTLTSMAHAEALYGGQLPDQVLDLLDAIKKLRTLEGDA